MLENFKEYPSECRVRGAQTPLAIQIYMHETPLVSAPNGQRFLRCVPIKPGRCMPERVCSRPFQCVCRAVPSLVLHVIGACTCHLGRFTPSVNTHLPLWMGALVAAWHKALDSILQRVSRVSYAAKRIFLVSSKLPICVLAAVCWPLSILARTQLKCFCAAKAALQRFARGVLSAGIACVSGPYAVLVTANLRLLLICCWTAFRLTKWTVPFVSLVVVFIGFCIFDCMCDGPAWVQRIDEASLWIGCLMDHPLVYKVAWPFLTFFFWQV